MAQLTVEYGRGDILANRYEVVERVDESALGVTYRVRQTDQGSYLRLLLLDPKTAGREQKEALMAAYKAGRDIKHKNLLGMVELGSHAGVAFVAMEDFEGGTLRDLINERRSSDSPLALREAAQIVMQVLEGLRALHEAGYVIGGLRPEQVWVAQRRAGPKGSNAVYDVRLAGGPLWSLVPPGALAEDEFTRGEAQYLAPELKTPTPAVSPSADLYSAGVLFYELLMGNPPVGTYQLPRQRRPELPQKVDDICELALSPAPSDRYPSAADFAADVKRSFTDAFDEPTSGTNPAARALWILGALLIAGLGILLYLRSATDPFEEALAGDNLLRKQVYEQHERPDGEAVRALLAKHPVNMTYVPPGPYVNGRLDHEPLDVGGAKAEIHEQPGFLIDVFEYPNLQGAPPKTSVSYTEAARLCQEGGKRLCSADEWEKACRGPENFVYSYGDTFDEDFCGRGLDDPHLAGALGECKSSWGVYDVSGNLREWTDTTRGDMRHIVKGGLPQAATRGTRCAFSTDLADSFADPTMGFRCCRDVDAPPAPVVAPVATEEAPPAEEAAPAEGAPPSP